MADLRREDGALATGWKKLDPDISGPNKTPCAHATHWGAPAPTARYAFGPLGVALCEFCAAREGAFNPAPPVPVEPLSAVEDPIESTPLGRARAAIDIARHDIEAAWDAWSEEPGPSGAYARPDLELVPDHASLGFALRCTPEDGRTEEASAVVAKLGHVLRKHGVARVECVVAKLDECDVG